MKSSQTSRERRSNSWKRHSRSGEKAQVIVITAFAIVVMFGIVGLAVDVGRMYAARAELGRAVDAAALAGVIEFPDATAASNRATAYLAENEPVAIPDIVPDAANNTLVVDASKTVNMYFIRVLGINTATVSAHAKAGFGVAYLDAVMVMDMTPSMVGDPVTNAKAAAINFKNTLLGTSPNGRTVIGLAPFRGCYRPTPLDNTFTNCIQNSSLQALTSNSTTLGNSINAMTAGGNTAATNVCTGLAKGWDILDGAGNHTAEENSRRYLILLSDGDNAYWGSYVYQAPIGVSSTSSPPGTTVASTDYPCQPYASCSSPWNTGANASVCHNGLRGILLASDSFSSGNLSGSGSGTPAWAVGSWTTVNVAATSSGSPNTASYHARITNTGTMARSVNFSGYDEATLSFNYKAVNWESGDRLYVETHTNCSASSGWTVRGDTGGYSRSGHENDYEGEEIVIPVANQTLCIRYRFVGGNSDDLAYIDDIELLSGGTSANGYLNGNDGSNPSTCNENPYPRERQIDVRTLNMARAIKAQNVEIFVVAFTAPTIPNCNLGSSTIWNDGDPAECNTVLDTPAGPIGDSTHDSSANVRLLKCIASSDDETSDHYFFANSASDLPGIFTQIAQQIAHRLIE